MDRYDIIIIGAGPAGCAAALFLHRQGLRVVVLDRARFPRDKVCGEFISPAADTLLDQLGVLNAIERTHPVRLRGVAVSSYGKRELYIDYPPGTRCAEAMTSLSLPRFQLDHLLVRQLVAEGIEIREGHAADDFLMEGKRVTGIRGRDEGNRRFQLSATVVVDASGRNGLSLRRLKLARPYPGPARIALAAHWESSSFPRDYCYMHISPPGYTGMAAVGEDSVNAVLVVDETVAKGRDLEALYQSVVLNNPRRRALLEGARLKENVRSVGSLAYGVKPVPLDGLVLAGDTTGFIDPFTGEGIYLSLRSAQVASEVIVKAFQAGDWSRSLLAEVEVRRHAEFHQKFVLSRLLQQIIYRRGLCHAVVALLRRNPQWAQTLVGVIGDYIPAERVVNWRFLMDGVKGALYPPPGTPPARVPGVGE